MCRAVITYLALVTMVFSFVFTPGAAYCLTGQSKSGPAVCKREASHECRHKACPMKVKAAGHRHDAPSEGVCKTFFKCADSGQDQLRHPVSGETIFLLSYSAPLTIQDRVACLPAHAASHLKDPAIPVDIPPKL